MLNVKKLVSVIVPLFNEENSLKIIFNELSKIKDELISQFDFEKILFAFEKVFK